MITDQQVRRLQMLINTEKTREIAASKAGMDRKTARKYLKGGKLPTKSMKEHTWRTREDPFKEIWEYLCGYLETNPGLEAKTLFELLQREQPGEFQDGQLRTLQRKIKGWRATKGPKKEVFFAQEHNPGELCESDFTHMTELGITINKELFRHMIYHFVLSYSNWEAGTICYSESFESLSEGLENALWELGGVPIRHRTDRLSAAVHKECNPEEFTDRYEGLLRHYGITGLKIQTGEANENGDIEQRHYRFKKALDQALMLRGSRNFINKEDYAEFLKRLFNQLNSGRKIRLAEELPVLRVLPASRLNDCKKIIVRVGPSSTIHVLHNTYSVDSRLIGEQVHVRVYAEALEVWYGQKKIDTITRLRGESKSKINYRHIIDWLIRKPGAFQQYRYRQDMFPTTIFRMAYDSLMDNNPLNGHKDYLGILYLASKESETGVQSALERLLKDQQIINIDAVKGILETTTEKTSVREIQIDNINLSVYDEFLTVQEAA
jgi:hypothetical protein